MNQPFGFQIAQVASAVVGLITLATTVLFVVIAWRAMRAHERIAATLEQAELGEEDAR